MSDSTDSTTSLTLLARLKNSADSAAWEEFVRRYGPRIYGWARRRGLQDADADDVTQDVLVKLAKAIHSFQPEKGKFRAWLATVTRNDGEDHREARIRAVPGSGDSAVQQLLEQEEAREDLAGILEVAELLEIIEIWVREHFQPQVGESWRLRLVEGMSGAEVAERLQIPEDNVHAYKHKVQEKIKERFPEFEPGNEE